jgi:hypothetical protein
LFSGLWRIPVVMPEAAARYQTQKSTGGHLVGHEVKS